MSNDKEKDPRAPTHIMVRARKYPTFRRAGFTFTDKWTSLELGELPAEKLKLLEDEPALEVVRGTARDAADATGERPDHRSRAELRAQLEAAIARAEKAEKALAEMRSKVESGAFAKPRSNDGRV